jgi:PDZ domain-containing protein GIPC
MPLFNQKTKSSSPTNGVSFNSVEMQQQPIPQMMPSPIKQNLPPSLVFHCQLANGSPTGLITGFSSVKELYQKIAECYDFQVDEVIFLLS